jgi:hypothetical protein
MLASGSCSCTADGVSGLWSLRNTSKTRRRGSVLLKPRPTTLR